MSFVLKIKYENNLRRLTLQRSDIENEGYSLAKLETRIWELFDLPANSPLAITYNDDEDDVVTLGNDQDLKDALVEQELNPLRIHVSLSKSKRAVDGGEAGKVAEADTPDVVLTRVLRTLSLTPEAARDTVKHAFQPYEELFEGVKSPAQIPGLVESFVQTLATQVSAAVKNGSAAAAAAAAANFGAPSERGFGAFPAQPPKAPRSREPASTAAPSSAPVGGADAEKKSLNVHHGVVCDICGVSPIVGDRWKSNVKFDYDLCSDCYESYGNEKEYVKIDQPKFRPRHLHGPHRMGHPFSYPTGQYLPFPPCHPGGSQHGKPFGGHGPFGGRGPFGGPGGRHHHGGHVMMGAADKLYARFVRDVTVFDGTEVAPETAFVKIWRLRNSGAAPWPVNTSVVFVGGDELGNSLSVPLEIPEQGLPFDSEIDVSVDMVAPEKPGRYLSHWRLADQTGLRFGQRLTVVIQVVPTSVLDGTHVELAAEENVPAEEFAAGTSAPSETPAAELADQQEVYSLRNLSPSVGTAFDVPQPAEAVKEQPIEKDEPAGDLTMLSFEDIEVAKSDAPDVAETETVQPTQEDSLAAEKEPLIPKEVPAPASRGFYGGGLISMVRNAVKSNSVTEPITQVAQKPADSPAPIPAAAAAKELGGGVEEEKSNISEGITYPVVEEVTQDEGPITYPVVDLTATEGANLPSAKALLSKLEVMGFTDSKLNYELLEKNSFDLRMTLDDLCAAEEWDPILEELEEMGFYDTVMNRRLMFKNNGSVKRVVKELVQMYRDIQGKREKVE